MRILFIVKKFIENININLKCIYIIYLNEESDSTITSIANDRTISLQFKKYILNS